MKVVCEATTVAETFDGYPTPVASALAHSARVGAMLCAITRISELLEEYNDCRDVFPLATAIQACTESAGLAGEKVDAALTHLSNKSETSHV